MVLEQKIRVDVKTKKDVPEELRMEIEKYDKIKKIEKTVEYLLTNVHTYEVAQDRFKKDPELLFAITIPDKNMPLIEKIESNCITLGKICDNKISEGDTTRKEEQMVIERGDYKSLPEDVKPNYKKVVRGGDVKRYVIQWSGDYIKQLREIPSGARLLIKDIAKRLTVAYDDEAYRCLRTVYCACPKDEKTDAKYLLGLLNSTLLHFYYMSYFYTSQMSPREGNFRFRTQFTKRLPMSYANNELQEQIVKQVKRIISLKKEMLNLEHKVAHFPNPYLEDG